MFTTLKKIAKATYSHIAPAIFSVGRVISSAGQVLFTLPKFIHYVTNNKNYPRADFSASIIVVLFNIIVNSATRVPAIYRQFRQTKNIQPESPRYATRWCGNSDKKMGYKGMTFFFLMKTCGLLSAFFTSLNAHLGSITFIEFIAKHGFNSDIHDEEWKEAIVQSIAFFFAVSNFVSYLNYNLYRIEMNAKKFAENIDQGNIPRNKEAIAATVISLLSVYGIPFFAYLTTKGSVNKIFGEFMLEGFKRAIAGTSAMSSIPSYLMSNIPALYSVLHGDQNDRLYLRQYRWEKPVKITVYSAGVGDSIQNMISTFTGLVNTSHEVFNIDPKGSFVIPAVIGSICTGTLYFVFGVYDGVQDSFNDFHDQRGEFAYKLSIQFGEQDRDEEAGEKKIDSGLILSENPSPKTNRQASSPFLFKIKTKPEPSFEEELKPYYFTF